MLDYIRAHRKVLLAGVSLLLVQVVDSDTADWIVASVGTLLTLLVPNDPAAIGRVYGR